ncbi:MAG: hypothetical protein PHU42_03575 [Patescibacteria group bacterium]|nr:hypothetical protein [Patescibacteria group bacterium]
MLNKHYKSYSFRIDERTLERVKNLKKSTGKSHNLLFISMIELYEKKVYNINKKKHSQQECAKKEV